MVKNKLLCPWPQSRQSLVEISSSIICWQTLFCFNSSGIRQDASLRLLNFIHDKIDLVTITSSIIHWLKWVKEWWLVSHFVCNFCDYSPYYCSRWHQLAWNFDRYFLFQKLVPFSSLILTYSIRILKILNIKHNLLVKYPQNISICGEYSQA